MWFKKIINSTEVDSNYDAKNKRGKIEPDFSFLDNMKSGKNSIQFKDHTNNKNNKENMGSMGNSYKIPAMTIFDTKSIQKLAQYDLMKSERDFYFSKLKDIDHIIDVYKDSSVENLTQAIKEILYLPPEKIATISDEGAV